jgi:hypothetical protein
LRKFPHDNYALAIWDSAPNYDKEVLYLVIWGSALIMRKSIVPQVPATQKYYSHNLMSVRICDSLSELGELPYVGKFNFISF